MMRISRKVPHLLFAVALLAGLLPLTVAAQPAAPIEQVLLDQLASGSANFFVKLSTEADTSAGKNMDWAASGQYVWNALNEVARTTQAPILDHCRKNGMDCTPMIINNSVFVRGGTLDSARNLAALPGVSYLRQERIYQLEPIDGGVGVNGAKAASLTPDAKVDWGLTDVHAPEVWGTLGVRGAGIKVANIDTGVQYDHPALDQSYACPSDPGNADCWADPSDVCGGTPCDNAGHGTHTMGTMVGDDDPSLTYAVGMAPDATWIACKGCEDNSCSDYALTTCAEWILAPGGETANRPNVVNNSWGGGGGDTWYQSYVRNWINAQIFPAFSAGNSGSSCGTLGSPGDYPESFASAAHASSRTIASFSSRGPSAFGNDPYTKPNISAPGVSVCSSVPTSDWDCGYSGTSMASPHTAGAVALLWSGCPDLLGQIDVTTQILQNNTDAAPDGNCGTSPAGGNYTYGYGYLNALTAVSACIGGVDLGTLQGYVYDQDDKPVEGATVTAVPAAESAGVEAATDPTGFYTMRLAAGTYNVTAQKTNYTSQTVNGIVITKDATENQNFQLTFLGAWTQVDLPSGCPDWYRDDAEFFPATGLAYIMGGRPGSDTDGSIYSFDPATQTCADTGVDMPVPISNYTVVLLNNGTADVLCTFGGRDADAGYATAVQCYDPVANTALAVSTLPGELGSFIPGGAAAVGNTAYVFGGFRNTESPYHTAQTWAWDPATGVWAQKGDLTLGRGYIEVAVVDGKIYGFGGDTFFDSGLVAEKIAEVFDPATGLWDDAAVADLATESGEGRGFGFDSASDYELAGQIVLAGGGIWQSNTNAAILYDVASNAYDEAFPDLSTARRDHAGFFVPGNPGAMWVIGGFAGEDAQPFGPPEYYEVPAGGAGQTLTCGAITAVPRLDAYGRYLVMWQVEAVDEGGTPMGDVSVTAAMRIPGGRTYARTRLTHPNGVARFHWGSYLAGNWSIDVTDMELSGYAFVDGTHCTGTFSNP